MGSKRGPRMAQKGVILDPFEASQRPKSMDLGLFDPIIG